MGYTVEELLAKTSSRALARWMAYYRLEPWGAVRDDVRALWVGQTNMAPWSKSMKLRPKDFFAHLFGSGRQSDEEMCALARAWAESAQE